MSKRFYIQAQRYYDQGKKWVDWYVIDRQDTSHSILCHNRFDALNYCRTLNNRKEQ